MCTLTVFQLQEGYRLAMNRDERRNRPLSDELRLSRAGERTYLHPVDPLAGGTWMAINDAGLTLALLNQSPPAFTLVDRPYRSRGSIIPALMESSSVETALSRARETLIGSEYPPFCLFGIDAQGFPSLLRWNGETWDEKDQDSESGLDSNDSSWMLASSSWRESEVCAFRRTRFEAFRRECPHPSPSDLLTFHRQREPGLEAWELCMERPESRTVSFSLVEFRHGSSYFIYSPSFPEQIREDFAILSLGSASTAKEWLWDVPSK